MDNKPTYLDKRTLWLLVLTVGLGYAVDVYDLFVFAIVRKDSLLSLGYSETQSVSIGKTIISIQMLGLLIGGLFWGSMGDKKGRKAILFASIFFYSLMSVANAFVHNATQYAVCRFLNGFGLSAELGAGIALISEILPINKRNYAYSIVVGMGTLGTLLLYLFYNLSHHSWRTCYLIGGGLGMLLLFLRTRIPDSLLFEKTRSYLVQKGNILQILTDKKRLQKYLYGILIGVPNWFVLGILISFADHFADLFGVAGIDASLSVFVMLLFSFGGDISASLVSQWLQSRKKTVLLYLSIAFLFALLFLFTLHNASSFYFFLCCAGLGFSSGYFILYISIAAEQFGTNLRATATVSTPNMVRGTLPLQLLLLTTLEMLTKNYVLSAQILCFIVYGLAFLALYKLKESYHTDLDFVE
ncbi:MAG: MFS transporter [Phycisphaerales bacterium]|nr:MFS transporter [Phycisphaerales bacterium]